MRHNQVKDRNEAVPWNNDREQSNPNVKCTLVHVGPTMRGALTIYMLSHMAISGSRNPFLTPQGRSCLDSLPHLIQPLLECPFASMVSLPLSDRDQPDNLPMVHISRHHAHPPMPDIYENLTVKEKTMAGVSSWPANLHLSLNANNWLEWSCQLVMFLEMGQLNVYPLSLLKCPSPLSDRNSYQNWCGNDHMVLGFMWSHLFFSEVQCITQCDTSVEAYWILCLHHEQQSGLTQI